MPKGEYRPQLDGLRAVAITLVVAYHLGFLPGGWIGVDVFFVLSGYLITSILLSRTDSSLRGLGRFWGRRAKRLLPAVLLMLAVVVVYASLGGAGVVPAQLRAPALATTFYLANWQEIVGGHGYFAQFASPNPFQHTWSLAIEEQYYLLWPVLLSLLVQMGRRRSGRPSPLLLTVVAVLGVSSMVWMGVAAHMYGANRAYLGTDTRAWELLAGGFLALLWPSQGEQQGGRRWSALAATGLVGVMVGACLVGGPPGWVWDGGLVAIAAFAGMVIVGVIRDPVGWVARSLSSHPLRWLGLISYSLYLWHWPVIVILSPENTGLSTVPLLMIRLVTMFAASCVSYYLIESPLRRADWGGLGRRLHVPAFSFWSAGIIASAALTVVGTVGPAAAGSGQLVSAVATDLPSPAPQPGLRPINVPSGSATHPYRVWLFGDSVMADASPGVTAALEATGKASVVANSSYGGWGMTTDRGFPGDVQAMLSQDHPQIAMGTWSWDDTLASIDPTAYTERLEDAIRTLLSPAYGLQAVILVQFPQPGPATAIAEEAKRFAGWAHQTAVQEAWDADARLATSAFPGRALYLTTDRLFAPGGRFFTWFPTAGGGWVRARKLDNAHFCPFGAAEFGQLLTSDLSEVVSLSPPPPGWQLGTWTRDPRYNDPPGACPGDQPPARYRGITVPQSKN